MRVRWNGRMFFRILRNLLAQHLRRIEGANEPNILGCGHVHGMREQRP
jgi:hypothetical protein